MRRLLKGLANAIAASLVLPTVLLYRIFALALGPEQVFPGWAQAFALLPGLVGVTLRRAFYRSILPRCGPDAWIGFGTVLSHPTAEVGRRVYIGMYCCLGDVTLEDDVLLGSHVSVMNGNAQHGIARLDIPIREQPGVWTRVTIGRDSWIGERSVVMANIGAQCVVGAGSVVVRPLNVRAIAVGVPAKVIRMRIGADNGPEFTGIDTECGPAMAGRKSAQ